MGKFLLIFCLIVLSVFIPATASALEADEQADAQQPQPSGITELQNEAIKQQTSAAETQGMTKMEKYFYYGDKLFAAKDYTNAVKYYYAATKLEPANVNAWKKTAFCYYQLKKHNYAYSAFQKVLKYDKNDRDALQFMDFYKTVMETNRKKTEKREMTDSLWRSCVLPGWGQIHNNQAGKGIIIGGAFIASVGMSVFNVADEKAKYDKYVRANENWEIAYKEAQDAWTGALIWGIVGGIIYAAGAADAALNYDCEEARTAFLDYRDNALCICAQTRW
ncbi:MAG: DUF5683 domain-containing protein [Spirochaetia bacterium]|nr:DUF5683 domain-containing protein [Spirochaetia bacterium]